MYYKGHGEVKVDIMLLLIANSCWTRSFALGYWLFYVPRFLTQMRKENICRKKIVSTEYVCCLIYPCSYWGRSIFVTVGNYIVSNRLIARSIMVRHMILVLVLSLPLRVYYLMRCTHTLFGESLWKALIVQNHILGVSLVFGIFCKIFSTGWYVHTFSVLHGFCCLFKTWVAWVLKVTVIPTDCLVM